MENNGARDLAIMTKVNGKTKIIDVNYGLVRLNMHQNNVNTYIYDNSNLTNQYKWQKFYFNGSYGEDGGFLGTSHDSGQWAAHIRIADTTGWVGEKDYEVAVPILLTLNQFLIMKYLILLFLIQPKLKEQLDQNQQC